MPGGSSEQRKPRATPAFRRVAVIAALVAVSGAASGCARGDRLDVSDPDGLVREVELHEEGSVALPRAPRAVDESTLRVPFMAGSACDWGDSVKVEVDGGGDEPVTLTITSRDNGTNCDDMAVARTLDVTFEPGVDIEAVRIVEE